MKERIKQLAEQAGLDMCGCGCNMPTRQVSKFAELIVQECAELCERIGTVPYSGISPEYAECSREIQKHFGVE